MVLLSSFYNVIYIVLAIFAVLALGGFLTREREEKKPKIDPRNIHLEYFDSQHPKASDTFNTYIAGARFYCDSDDLRCFVGFVYFDPEDEAPRVYRNDLEMLGHIPRERLDEYYKWCPGHRTFPCVGYVLRGNTPEVLETEIKVIKPYNAEYVEQEARNFVNWMVVKRGTDVDVKPEVFQPILDHKNRKKLSK